MAPFSKKHLLEFETRDNSRDLSKRQSHLARKSLFSRATELTKDSSVRANEYATLRNPFTNLVDLPHSCFKRAGASANSEYFWSALSCSGCAPERCGSSHGDIHSQLHRYHCRKQRGRIGVRGQSREPGWFSGAMGTRIGNVYA